MTAPMIDQLSESDAVLLGRVRGGDHAAYGKLFERHRSAATAFARRLAGASHADDVVAEAFAKVFDALQRGVGPTVSFRAYLMVSIRTVWTDTVRAEVRYDLIGSYDELPALDAVTVFDDPDRRFDNGAVARAFQSLPERWQAVLWYTAVEGGAHAEVAVHLGIKTNAVAALNFRAREGLRQAYLAAHLGDSDDVACRRWASSLPSFARGSLDSRKRPGLEAHLDGCLRCTTALADLRDVNERLGALLVPIVLGPGVLGAGWSGLTTLGGGAPAAAATAGKAATASLAAKAGLATTTAASLVGAVIAVPLLLAGSGRESSSTPESEPASAAQTVVAEEWRPRVPKPRRAKKRTSVDPGPAAASAPALRRPTGERRVGRLEQKLTTMAEPAPEAAIAPPPSASSPTVPTAPTVPTPPSVPRVPEADIALGEVAVTTDSTTRISRIEIPVSNLRAGAVLTVSISNLLAPPLRLSGGWRCEGTIDGNVASADQVRSTSVECTWHGGEAAADVLVLGVLSVGASQIEATVAPAPGISDPVPANNTASSTITA